MVFKFERKSTEKKCEKKERNGAYYGKKFCNNRNLSECMCKLRQMLTFF